ncbi:hypothetical protein [Paenibacillus chitinolyticus]|uniref:hypothetical protein n=1 Tax=Paenibacillus chitinolyticus TaxID=79263 RepID=UPI003630F131
MYPQPYYLEKEMEQHNRDLDRRLRDYTKFGRFLHSKLMNSKNGTKNTNATAKSAV